MTLKNRRVVVLGLGITGLSAARWATRQGARVSVADTRTDPPCAPQLRAELPALDVLAAHEREAHWPDVFVSEWSSFQLETTSSLKPVATTVLNVTQNHLDRYRGIDEYAAAKARIFAGGGEQILNRDDARSLAMAVPGRIVQTFGAGIPHGEHEWGLVERKGAPWLARGGALLLAASELALVGRHNALNALAALALASTIAKIDGNVLAALAAFRGLPHRMERV